MKRGILAACRVKPNGARTASVLAAVAMILALFGAPGGWHGDSPLLSLPAHAAPTVWLSHGPPLAFEVNRGQTDRHVRYLARTGSSTLFLTSREAVLSVATERRRFTRPFQSAAPRITRRVVEFQPVGARTDAPLRATSRLPGVANYLIGSNPARWRTNIPTYARVEYQGVYPGIDLAYYGRQGHLEYDWIAAPGAHVDRIKLHIRGVDGMRVDAGGALVLRLGGLEIRQARPLTYIVSNGAMKRVPARYVLLGAHQVGFQVSVYDRSKTLIIDPTLVYSTYLGGGDIDGGMAVAADGQGNAYVTGDTESPDFPLAQPAQGTLVSDPSCASAFVSRCTDAFVSKLSPDGSRLIYSTYLGGRLDDYGKAIAVDGTGAAYVTGSTRSPDFPISHALQARYGGGPDAGDAFVTKLSSAGNSLVYSTFLGGGRDDDGEAIAVEAGSAYITGATDSTDFPTAHAYQAQLGGGMCTYPSAPTGPCNDAFVAKLTADGTALDYSTYVGGRGSDIGMGIAVRDGSAFVGGTTDSPDLRTVHAFQPAWTPGICGVAPDTWPCNDAFLIQLDPSGGTAVYSTYLGGSQEDVADDVAVGPDGSAYIVGGTRSTDFPLAHAIQTSIETDGADGYVARFTPGGSLAYSTYLGGSADDEVYGVAVDAIGDMYLAGSTNSTDFPTVNALEGPHAGAEDVQNGFVSVLEPGGQHFVYSTYLGGSGHDLAGHIALDGVGNAYVVGSASSTDFPLQHPLQGDLAGGMFDAFVAKIYHPMPLPPTPTATPTATPRPRASPTPRPAKKKVCKKGYKLVKGKCKKVKKKPL